MPRIRVAFASLLGLIALFAAAPAAHGHASDEHVGDVNFPTSCAAQVQPSLDKGLALLHSFQYSESEQSFGDAAQHDPQCAMAYWGKAMSQYYLLWDFPDEKQLAEGRKDVELAQKAGEQSPREREYVAAAAAFFNADPKLSHADRTKLYVAAMAKLYGDNPSDVEAGALYALSLVSLAQYNVDELANRRKAIAVLDPLFAAHPNNPGVAHYLIHASDVPELAREGLPAARVYAKIAPDSSHATHMPSHIFRRLGLWQETIDSNIAAIAAAADATKAGRGDASYQFHPMDFLNYAYLQSGQESKARQLVDECKSVPGAKPEQIADHQSLFEARDAMELHRWKEAAALPVHTDQKFIWQDTTYWARAIGAARSGDLAGAREDAKKLREIMKAQSAHDKELGNPVTPGESVEKREADAWIAFAEKKSDAAIADLRAASEREETGREGPLAGPAREMLADMLLELKRPQEALNEYQRVLKDYPNRFDAVYGAAQAAEAASHHDQAQAFYAQLVKISLPGADRPELQTAKWLSAGH
jgi:tetratricopeptide (TPR) repeat protein